ncbi:hypothetical protein HY638_03425 [Candidatus Woesearchaeota archaeon]|nr:hypothetical protein [Candidatus Woesearchaeota archaeon]
MVDILIKRLDTTPEESQGLLKRILSAFFRNDWDLGIRTWSGAEEFNLAAYFPYLNLSEVLAIEDKFCRDWQSAINYDDYCKMVEGSSAAEMFRGAGKEQISIRGRDYRNIFNYFNAKMMFLGKEEKQFYKSMNPFTGPICDRGISVNKDEEHAFKEQLMKFAKPLTLSTFAHSADEASKIIVRDYYPFFYLPKNLPLF